MRSRITNILILVLLLAASAPQSLAQRPAGDGETREGESPIPNLMPDRDLGTGLYFHVQPARAVVFLGDSQTFEVHIVGPRTEDVPAESGWLMADPQVPGVVAPREIDRPLPGLKAQTDNIIRVRFQCLDREGDTAINFLMGVMAIEVTIFGEEKVSVILRTTVQMSCIEPEVPEPDPVEVPLPQESDEDKGLIMPGGDPWPGPIGEELQETEQKLQEWIDRQEQWLEEKRREVQRQIGAAGGDRYRICRQLNDDWWELWDAQDLLMTSPIRLYPGESVEQLLEQLDRIMSTIEEFCSGVGAWPGPRWAVEEGLEEGRMRGLEDRDPGEGSQAPPDPGGEPSDDQELDEDERASLLDSYRQVMAGFVPAGGGYPVYVPEQVPIERRARRQVHEALANLEHEAARKADWRSGGAGLGDPELPQTPTSSRPEGEGSGSDAPATDMGPGPGEPPTGESAPPADGETTAGESQEPSDPPADDPVGGTQPPAADPAEPAGPPGPGSGEPVEPEAPPGPAFGPFSEALGQWLGDGGCGPGTEILGLADSGGQLVLQLETNPPILLRVEGNQAVGEGVVLFGVSNHRVVLTLAGDTFSLQGAHANGGSCVAFYRRYG